MSVPQTTTLDHLKKRAENILQHQGIAPSVAETLFYVEVIHYGGLPFEPMTSIPSDLTIKTIRDSRAGKNVMICKDKKDFFEKLKR